jgi:hypothetical protein
MFFSGYGTFAGSLRLRSSGSARGCTMAVNRTAYYWLTGCDGSPLSFDMNGWDALCRAVGVLNAGLDMSTCGHRLTRIGYRVHCGGRYAALVRTFAGSVLCRLYTLKRSGLA